MAVLVLVEERTSKRGAASRSKRRGGRARRGKCSRALVEEGGDGGAVGKFPKSRRWRRASPPVKFLNWPEYQHHFHNVEPSESKSHRRRDADPEVDAAAPASVEDSWSKSRNPRPTVEETSSKV